MRVYEHIFNRSKKCLNKCSSCHQNESIFLNIFLFLKWNVLRVLILNALGYCTDEINVHKMEFLKNHWGKNCQKVTLRFFDVNFLPILSSELPINLYPEMICNTALWIFKNLNLLFLFSVVLSFENELGVCKDIA